MYSLHLKCRAEEVERISVDLWEAGTVGIREEESGENIELIAGFEDDSYLDWLLAGFISYDPSWVQEDDKDWVAATHDSWPARRIGERIFLAPPWNTEATPANRVRVIHNPGMASGTGEHPCTQLALESLERCVSDGCIVADVGTGSGILSVAARKLGAKLAAALDIDLESLETAHENFELNGLQPTVVGGTVECLASEVADVVVANISGTVLLSLADELLRAVRPAGLLILTGFPESELAILQRAFGNGEVTGLNEWRCFTLKAAA